MPYIERVAASNNRVTKGKLYAMLDHRIIDDLGSSMHPQYKMTDYWRIVPSNEEPNQPAIPKLINKEITMLKVETVTLINGQRLSDFKVDTLIGYIQKEEAHIGALEQVNAQSTAINGLKNRHQVNIKALVAILDDMDPEDE